MRIKIKKISVRLLVALLTFTTGVAITMLWVVSHMRTVSPPAPAKVAETLKEEHVSSPDGWKDLNIKDKVTLRVPQDMKPAELLGDSYAHREAYVNKDLHLTIVYGEVLPPRHEHDPIFDACELSASLQNDSAYHESIIDIHGHKAKLGIDLRLQPKYTAAHVCFPHDAEGNQLIVLAGGSDQRAMQLADQIFASIRFKENK